MFGKNNILETIKNNVIGLTKDIEIIKESFNKLQNFFERTAQLEQKSDNLLKNINDIGGKVRNLEQEQKSCTARDDVIKHEIYFKVLFTLSFIIGYFTTYNLYKFSKVEDEILNCSVQITNVHKHKIYFAILSFIIASIIVPLLIILFQSYFNK